MSDQTTVLNQNFLDLRCLALELAAGLDRVDRAAPPASAAGSADPRGEQLRQALHLLAGPAQQPDRARRMLLLFSDPVD